MIHMQPPPSAQTTMEELKAHLSAVQLREHEQQVSNVAAAAPTVPAAAKPSATDQAAKPSVTDQAAAQVAIKYLNDYWPHSQAARALMSELRSYAGDGGEDMLPDLHSLVLLGRGEKRREDAAMIIDDRIGRDADGRGEPQVILPQLVGPAAIPHVVTHTHSTLHTNNILTIRNVLLPRRQFITSPAILQGQEPHFSTTVQNVLVSTSSDKQVLFFDPETGDVIESLDPVQRVLDLGHTSPVLDVAQHPIENREFVTVGMDGKVCVWDLLKRKVICEKKEHTRFIVRCKWDESGKWLATAGYDKRIVLYRRTRTSATGTDMDTDDDDEDDIEVADLTTQLEPIHTLETRSNPEAIHFITNQTDQTTWLVYSLRDDCFIHYICLSDLVTNPTPRQLSFNTNENPFDTHRSYSIISITSHPNTPIPLLSLLTGAHSSTSSTSQLLLLPYFSDQRSKTIHTTIPTSEHYSPRHVWIQDGSGVYITSEEGWLKLYDTNGKERCVMGIHGLANGDDGRGMSAEEKAKRWRMGGMNGSIRDLDLLVDGSGVVTCGFDRTVRVVRRVDESSKRATSGVVPGLI